jgi:hypothetical protein
MTARRRLSDRRPSETFDFECNNLRYGCTISRFEDGGIGEVFLNNHKFGNQSDTNARDAAIVFSFAIQHGADADAIRRALCRKGQGRPLGSLGAALDILVEDKK